MERLSTVQVEVLKRYLGIYRSIQLNCKLFGYQNLLLKSLFCSLLHDNELGRIKSDGLFGRLPNLVKLDLRRNQITGIEENSFEGASRISEL